MTTAYRILSRKRAGEPLTEEEIRLVVDGAARGTWSDAQLAAFLMAAAIRGLGADETRHLTLGMLESGERWDLAAAVPGLADKHSTGGVGDKVSLVLAPLMAAAGVPMVMLTGRGLGHTGGTADKLEVIPGLRMELDRSRCLELLETVALAVGVATRAVAPADRRLYRLRDATATVDSLPLITASILSKKLATGAEALIFDVKTGSGAFMVELDRSRQLAELLVDTCAGLGLRASAVITDMSQPLGDWVGHRAEVAEALACLEGRGPAEVMEVVFALAAELARLVGRDGERRRFEELISDGSAREVFDRWAVAQGADAVWLASPDLELAPASRPVRAPRSGTLARVATRRVGLLLAEAGGGRSAPGGEIDAAVSLRYVTRLGRPVEAGDELARVYLRRDDDGLLSELAACFEIADEGSEPPLVVERVRPDRLR